MSDLCDPIRALKALAVALSSEPDVLAIDSEDADEASEESNSDSDSEWAWKKELKEVARTDASGSAGKPRRRAALAVCLSVAVLLACFTFT